MCRAALSVFGAGEVLPSIAGKFAPTFFMVLRGP